MSTHRVLGFGALAGWLGAGWT